MTSVELRVEGDTDDERAASCVRAMIEAGLAVKLSATADSSSADWRGWAEYVR